MWLTFNLVASKPLACNLLVFASTALHENAYTYLGVGLSVSQQVLDEVDGLGWPSGLGDTEFLTLTGTTDRRVETTERNGSLVV